MVAPSGRTKLDTSSDTPRLFSTHFMVTGRVAALELVDAHEPLGVDGDEDLAAADPVATAHLVGADMVWPLGPVALGAVGDIEDGLIG